MAAGCAEVLALHITLGAVLDAYSYAPSAAQEWLYPGLLAEHGRSLVGYIPSAACPACEAPLRARGATLAMDSAVRRSCVLGLGVP